MVSMRSAFQSIIVGADPCALLGLAVMLLSIQVLARALQASLSGQN